MVRARLECAVVVCFPHVKKDVKKLKRIQKTAMKMLPKLKDLDYEDRLKEMRFLTLQDRRERDGLIIMYKIINDK